MAGRPFVGCNPGHVAGVLHGERVNELIQRRDVLVLTAEQSGHCAAAVTAHNRQGIVETAFIEESSNDESRKDKPPR
jgi:hypothetical protein